VYTSLKKKLMRHEALVSEMFHTVVDVLSEGLPGFGERLAVDSKAVRTHARARRAAGASSDPDADWGTNVVAMTVVLSSG